MAYCDAMDSGYILLRRWLDAVRAQNGTPDTEVYAWRPHDSENNIQAKILRSYCLAFSVADSDQLAYRHLDTENDLYRKILGVLHVGIVGLPTDPAHNWRLYDGERDLLAKILRCLCIDAANTDLQADFLPMDSEMLVLRKIVSIY
jgi:hypothetical protein